MQIGARKVPKNQINSANEFRIGTLRERTAVPAEKLPAGRRLLRLYCECEKKLKIAEAVRELGGVPTEFSFEFHGPQNLEKKWPWQQR